MKALIIFSALIVFTLLMACKKDKMLGEIGQEDCSTVTYSQVIKPLFDRTCGGSDCHGNGAPYGAITNYSNTKRYADNGDLKKEVLDTRDMPIGITLTAAELGQVQCWLDGGAVNN